MIHMSFPVYMLVHGWRALTEGHGSCTLSVWTLAEPLGVLFQARSDNLAPMTRLATAQFTGRSSTHAQPPPPPTTTSLSLLFSPHPLSAPPAPSFTSLLYPPSPLNFSQSLPSCCVFSQPLLLSLLSISITLLSTRLKLSAGILGRRVLQTMPVETKCLYTLTSLSSLRNEFFLLITKSFMTLK